MNKNTVISTTKINVILVNNTCYFLVYATIKMIGNIYSYKERIGNMAIT